MEILENDRCICKILQIEKGGEKWYNRSMKKGTQERIIILWYDYVYMKWEVVLENSYA